MPTKNVNNKSTHKSIRMPADLDKFIKAYQKENDIDSYGHAVILLLTESMVDISTAEVNRTAGSA
jgi:hypothetical protein